MQMREGEFLFSIKEYCEHLQDALMKAFNEKFLYMGLQGSYLRGEATEHSDIDIMVILEELSVSDLKKYREAVESVGDADRACGFICSAAEMRNWNPLESCQVLHSTKDIYGSLAQFLPAYTTEDVKSYVKISLNNLYHALCHSFIHGTRERLAAHLPAYYKAAYFILQNTHFLESGAFPLKKEELRDGLSGSDREVMDTLLSIDGEASDTDSLFAQIFDWCKATMKKYE